MIRKQLILVMVAFAMFMETVDSTIINTAIPVMANSLQANPIDLKLALISYLLSLAICIPISGWLADKYGIKTVYLFGLTLFTLSSAACGFSTTLNQLIVTRFIQGIGGSLTLPIGRLIIIRTWPRHELVAKTGFVVMIGSFGLMLGPVLGGVITTHFSWRWIFWVNVPFGSLAVLFSMFLLPASPPSSVHPLDKLGFLLFGGGLSLLTYSLSAFSESSSYNVTSAALLLLAVLLLFFYSWHARQQIHPVVRVTLLQLRTFRISVLGNLCARLGFGGMPFLLPLLLQIGLQYSPQTAGLLLAPMAVGVLSSKPFATIILQRLGYKRLLLGNTLLISMALLFFCFIDATTSFYTISGFTFIYGFLISLQYTGMNSLAYAQINPSDISAATSIMSTIQQLAQSFGVAFAALVIKFLSVDHTISDHLSLRLLHQSFVALSIATFFSMVIFLFLDREDGKELLFLG